MQRSSFWFGWLQRTGTLHSGSAHGSHELTACPQEELLLLAKLGEPQEPLLQAKLAGPLLTWYGFAEANEQGAGLQGLHCGTDGAGTGWHGEMQGAGCGEQGCTQIGSQQLLLAQPVQKSAVKDSSNNELMIPSLFLMEYSSGEFPLDCKST